MKQRIFAKGKRAACLLLMFALLSGLCPAASARAEERTFTGSFRTFKKDISCEYAYSDDYFTRPSDQYDHRFARLSLGLALASFRDKKDEKAQDADLISYFESMGFSDIETAPYRKNAEPYSVAYGLASKKIGGATVLACAVCSGNYGKEWASNLTIEDTVRPKGFQDSSLKVQEAIADYRSRHPADKVKLWIVGFSRGGAVSNLTAADCIASGQFADVYAYTFATPRTTKEPVEYPNIFNIMQKEDLVPKIPLEDWGYQRYGRDLYLVGAETDPDREDVLKRADQVYRDLVGAERVTNPEVNYQLRILMDYLLLLMPDPSDYKELLQTLLVGIMTKEGDTAEALQVLYQALNEFSTDDPKLNKELKAMSDYLGTLIGIYYLQGGTQDFPPDMWDPQFGTKNLFNGHFPFEYLAMMFASDDPEELFSENNEYLRVAIYGKVDASISDGKQIIKEIRADGRELVDGKEDPYSLPDAVCYDKRILITLPANRGYKIEMRSQTLLPQTVTYTSCLFSGHTVKAVADKKYSTVMHTGEKAEIYISAKKKAIESSVSDHSKISVLAEAIYSPTTSMRMENNKVTHLTISGFANRLLLLLVILILQGIASLICTIVRRKQGRARNKAVAFVWHGAIAFLFTLLEVSLWYFVPVIHLAKMIPGILVFAVIVIYAMKGCYEGRRQWKRFWIIVGAMAAYEVLESMLIGDFAVWKAIMLIAVYTVFMAASYYFLWHEPKGEDA